MDLACYPLEILSVRSGQKMQVGNGQVDRQVFSVFAALQRCLDGQHSDVRSIFPGGPKNERITRCETTLDPNTPQSREMWKTTQMINHAGLTQVAVHTVTT